VRDERLYRSLPRVLRNVFSKRFEHLGDWLDPQHVEIVARIQRTFLADIRPDVDHAVRRAKESIRIGPEPATQPTQDFHRRAAYHRTHTAPTLKGNDEHYSERSCRDSRAATCARESCDRCARHS